MEMSDFYYIDVSGAPHNFRQAASQHELGLSKTGHFCRIASKHLAKFDSYKEAEAFLNNVKKERSRANTRYTNTGKLHFQVRYHIFSEDQPVMNDAASSEQALLDDNPLVDALV